VLTCFSTTEVGNEPAYSGLYRQVVLVLRCFSTTEVGNEPAYSGLYRQVVLVLRCFSTTEVGNEPAYHGLYGHVVFICKWSSRQVSLPSQGGGGGHSHKESKGDKPRICANKRYFHNFKRFPCPEMKPCT
jgi:hypothetical protein